MLFLRLFIVFTLISLVKSLPNDSLSQKTGEFWDETKPFAQSTAPSPNLRLPSEVVPSFYRLKIKADLESSFYSGEVHITIRASKKVKEIVLHSKNLTINKNVKLTEQIYEKVETLHMRSKRDIPAVIDNNVTSMVNRPVLANNPNTNGVAQNIINESAIEAKIETIVTPEVKEVVQNISDKALEPNNTSNNNIVNLDAVERNSDNVVETTTKATIQTNNAIVDTDTQVTHSSVRNIKIASISDAPGDRLVLTLATALKPNVDYILEIPFEGLISNSLTGFYKSTYTDENKVEKSLAVTQFEPTSARAAFPCFDEPGFKAKFEISIAHRKNMTALSNMKVAAKEPIADQPEWEWTHFERSVKMSTYLVAYVLCDFVSLDTSYVSKDNMTKPIRIWTRPELIKKAEYAASITPKLLEFYEEVFGLPYALDKLDLIAIPDFSSGAMENWGLITFRETGLLFEESSGSPRDKQTVAIDVAHELAHQWFGNLVTMRWWTDLWLNEGFATYIEYVGVDHIEPSWNMFEDLTSDMLDLFRTDALKNTSPVSRRVEDASEISQKFDEISYTKGANLIRMLNNTLTEGKFREGLVLYLNQWKYANAEENDLWESMSAAVSSEPAFAGRSLVQVMNSWTRQPGYPLLTVTRDYDTGTVHFQQSLFSSSKTPYKWMQEQLWQIPINYIAADAPVSQWSTKPQLWLSERATSAPLPVNATQALYVNIGATSYYRVNYDQRNWELLSTALQAGHIKSPVTKSQLIDDAFNLAKADQLNYSYALGLTTCLINGDDSKMLWDQLLNNMGFIDHILKSTSGYGYFQDYMKILLEKQLQRLNYGLDKPKDENEALLIDSLVMWECIAEAPRCLDWARGLFNTWMNNPDVDDNPIPQHLRSLVYNMALKYGGRREFQFLWRVFQNHSDPNVKSLVINNLPSTRQEPLINMLLEKSLTELPKQYAVAAWSMDSALGARLARKFLADNFDRVYSTFTELDSFMFSAVLNGAFGTICTQEELDELKSFAMEHKDKLVSMSQTLQKLVDIAKLRIEWRQAHAQEVIDWFKGYLADRNNTTKTNVTAAQPQPAGLPVERSNNPDTNVPTNQLKSQQDQTIVSQNQPGASQILPGVPQNQAGGPQSQSDLTQNQPSVAQNQPGVAQNQPSIAQNQPGVLQNQPSVAQNQPSIAQNQPGVLQNQPSVAQNQPGIAQNQPSIAQNQPGVLQNQPGVAQNQPSVAQNQPGVLQNQPGVAQNQPSVAQNQPGVLQNQPSIAQNQPSVAQNQPVVAQNQPSVAQNQPIVAQNPPSVQQQDQPVQQNQPLPQNPPQDTVVAPQNGPAI